MERYSKRKNQNFETLCFYSIEEELSVFVGELNSVFLCKFSVNLKLSQKFIKNKYINKQKPSIDPPTVVGNGNVASE